ncbi:HAD family phosphatase [Pseudomonas nicosulfuronedens]|uniref:HAD family phosphatase n=1 Tax=Pseudomonas nicosulfuronedens TaxID=2571105 RepID=A0A5R9R7N2_9PSED|nr:HAD family phosphatase [Pseudomonas nicosulfuronedens]MDH1010248.1 HAD family phosphatase [Pseudomonas nicosulfuronedens]MDH1980271.1 HAD family phosphatase [Pseudomonas nicosulfuronedens]MDH2025483.1 HAD family phosphatase [Pseudomonas nicosulfuronedens]TLX78887.1 HAD family phosphatase [Pseudomonas nicosulfuronedens]
MPATADLPRFTTLLFGLSGDLVDFGARTLPVALQRTCPDCPPERLTNALTLPPQDALDLALGRRADTQERSRFQSALNDAAQAHAEATPGALDALQTLHQRGVPCAWLDELPNAAAQHLAGALDDHLATGLEIAGRQWPAPDSCWQALMQLDSPHLDGCVLVSGQPRLLQAGLNAGLWTIGLAASGPLCGHAPGDWDALGNLDRDRLRAQATLGLYRLGVHSVIDHLGELDSCLQDIAGRRLKGEKP